MNVVFKQAVGSAAFSEAEISRHKLRNRFAIEGALRAGHRVILTVGDGVAAEFNAFAEPRDVGNAVNKNDNATAWVIGRDDKKIPCPGFLSLSDLLAGKERPPVPKGKCEPTPKVEANPAPDVSEDHSIVDDMPAPVPDSNKAQAIADEKKATAAPAIVMKRIYAIPQRPKSAESLYDYIGESGAIKWPDLKKGWSGLFEPKSTCANARVAILALRIECGQDVFHDRKLVGGHSIQEWAGELSDHSCQMLRVIIQRQYGFDPGRENTRDAVDQLCIQNRFDPVIDYLDGLEWDGTPRLDKWLVQYLGAADTELNRAISRLSLVAAVRRARQPGCKFDQIIVLEGPEGKEKSMAIEIMAGEENFSDQSILGLDDKTQMERLKGKWLYEIAELTGIRRAEVEMVKAFVSRRTDRARPAYGRNVVEQPRRCVLFATTNEDSYLKSQTGNRRFWPLKTGDINTAALRRDRDQLWAEASRVEATQESIVLPKHLWSKARVEQDTRLEHDPWDDILEAVKGDLHQDVDGDEERVASSELLLNYLKIPAERATKEAERKLAQCMRRLGWEGPIKMRINRVPVRGYRRTVALPGVASDGRSPPWKREK